MTIKTLALSIGVFGISLASAAPTPPGFSSKQVTTCVAQTTAHGEFQLTIYILPIYETEQIWMAGLTVDRSVAIFNRWKSRTMFAEAHPANGVMYDGRARHKRLAHHKLHG